MGVEDSQRFRAVARLDHGIPMPLEQPANRGTNRRLILDQQEGLGSDSGIRWGAVPIGASGPQ